MSGEHTAPTGPPPTPPGQQPAPKTDGDATTDANLAAIESLLSNGKDDVEIDDLGQMADELEGIDDDDLNDIARKPRASLIAIIMFVVSIAAIIVGVIMISDNDPWKKDLDCFLTADIKKCKTAGVELQKKKWREEERATKPKYGDITLAYFPQDAKVHIFQSVEVQKGWKDDVPRTKGETKEIDNKSLHLAEHELIEQLPLVNLPIRERTRNDAGDVIELRHYAYRITIEREGYEPRELTINPNDWRKLGPDVNHAVAGKCLLSGPLGESPCDLVPKPETIREPFRKAMTEIYCARQWYGSKAAEKAGAKPEDLKAEEKEIQIRNGFKTSAEFEKFGKMLMADVEWWKPVWEEIQKTKCPERESAP